MISPKKHLERSSTYLFVMMTLIGVIWTACKKYEAKPVAIPFENSSPVAVANGDTILHFPGCPNGTGQIVTVLDASSSSETSNRSLQFAWKQIKGPTANILNPSSVTTECILPFEQGEYVFELTATNHLLKRSRDTTVVQLFFGPPDSAMIDLDLSTSIKFTRMDGVEFEYDSLYGDHLELAVDIPTPNGPVFKTVINTIKDTSSLDNFYTWVAMGTPSRKKFLVGDLDVNLSKIYLQGGGHFSSMGRWRYGNAVICFPDRYDSLPHILFSGNMDTLNRTISFKLKCNIIY